MKVRLTSHSSAVNIICVASKLCTKLGGNALACFTALTMVNVNVHILPQTKYSYLRQVC